MRKSIVFILAMLLGVSLSYAANGSEKNKLPVVVKPTNPADLNNQPPRGPILVPEVYLDGHELSFDSSLEGCTVRLLDEEETVVFTVVISTGQTSVTFPTTLTGTYELQIVCGSITFYCYIDL